MALCYRTLLFNQSKHNKLPIRPQKSNRKENFSGNLTKKNAQLCLLNKKKVVLLHADYYQTPSQEEVKTVC